MRTGPMTLILLHKRKQVKKWYGEFVMFSPQQRKCFNGNSVVGRQLIRHCNTNTEYTENTEQNMLVVE